MHIFAICVQVDELGEKTDVQKGRLSDLVDYHMCLSHVFWIKCQSDDILIKYNQIAYTNNQSLSIEYFESHLSTILNAKL